MHTIYICIQYIICIQDSVKVTLAGLPERQNPVNKKSNWNYNKPEGWQTYKKLTGKAENNLKEIGEKTSVENNTANETMKKTDYMENNIKSQHLERQNLQQKEC